MKTTVLALEPRLNDVFSFARSILYRRGKKQDADVTKKVVFLYTLVTYKKSPSRKIVIFSKVYSKTSNFALLEDDNPFVIVPINVTG